MRSAALLAGLPEWFGRPQANAGYLRDLSRHRSWVAKIDDSVVGAVTLHEHNAASFEIHFLAVERSRHRSGIGRVAYARTRHETTTFWGAETPALLLIKVLAP